MGPRVDIDFRNLPKDYVTEMFCQLCYDVEHYSGNNSYNGGCPICHEGRSFGKKKRCWWLPDKGIIHCFNCGKTWNPINFIKEAGGLNASDIAFQIRSGDFGYLDLDRRENMELAQKDEFKALLAGTDENLPEDSIDLTDESQLSYYKNNSSVLKALRYLESRRLLTAVNRPKTYYISLTDYIHRNRLVFPFFDRAGKVAFYQTRAIGANVDEYKEDIRYLGKVGAEKAIFNLENVRDDIEEIFVFEGPIDSCFLKNGVAVAGISKGERTFTELQESQMSLLRTTHKIVWVLDNQWVDETARVKSNMLMEAGEYVFMWPKALSEYKDFNELCVKRGLDEIPLELVRRYIYHKTENTKADMLKMGLSQIDKRESGNTALLIDIANSI